MEIVNLYDNQYCIPTVAGWIYAEFIEHLRPGISLDDVTAALRGRRQHTMPLTFVAMIDEQCIGTVSLVVNDLKARQDLTPWLASLYVRPDLRGQGVARRLIDHVIDAAAALGFQMLYLRTETAAAYYTRLGWRKIDAVTDEFNLFTEVFAWEIDSRRAADLSTLPTQHDRQCDNV
jgi:predicted N-acetyltransferase YhbS